MWFKFMLLGFIIFGVIVNLVDVSRGEYMKKNEPIASAIAAVLNALIALGVWFLL